MDTKSKIFALFFAATSLLLGIVMFSFAISQRIFDWLYVAIGGMGILLMYIGFWTIAEVIKRRRRTKD